MRRVLPLFAVLSLAFAPAPFPKPSISINLASFQGRWKVVRIEVTLPNGGVRKWDWDIRTIRVRDNHMAYLRGNASDAKADEFPIAMSPGKELAAIDWWLPGQKPDGSPKMVGLMRRRGDTIHILYKPGTGLADRPKQFENPPEGWYLKTIRRE
jgi:uncharacterized protein (TIGR03067 family)